MATVPMGGAVYTLLWLVMGFWSWLWLGPTWIAAIQPASGRVIDFYQDWGSARNYWTGLPVYTPHAISIPRHLGLASNPNPSIEYNMHPPTSVLLALPAGKLNYSAAVLIWNVVSLLALLASLVIVTAVLPIPKSLFLPALALLPFCVPVLGNLQMGQVTMILGFLITAMWALERSGRSRAAGLLLGAAAAIKLFPAFLAVYYAAQGRVRPLMAALVSFLTLTWITALVLGPDTFYDYITIVLRRHAEFRILGFDISIDGLWHKLFHPLNEGEKIIPLWYSPALARWGTLISNLVITLIVGVFIHRARTRSQRDLAFATAVTAMLLVSPVTWDISLLLLLVPLSIIGCVIENQNSKWMPLALVLILLIIWLPQPILTNLIMAGRPVEIAPPSFLLGAASIKFYALLGTFMLGLAALRADETKRQPSSVNGSVLR